MNAISTKVVIVGAGPAGLATAIGLAERGIDFVILDALAEAQNTSRAAVIHAATLDSLRVLKVADRLVAQGIKVPQFRIRDRDSVLLHVDFSRLQTPTPFALMIPQDESPSVGTTADSPRPRTRSN
ncbi:FAD-dependent oxidoreductase [Mesorhizobium yinganensis]|uniref:FAD-dependent oxidoreductase n=1 Tax=Mesorhizobium yinganensis TaxID=3157707 RepID=UPI0032B76B34